MTLPRPSGDGPSPRAVELASQRVDRWVSKWIGGGIVPVLLGLYGVHSAWEHHTMLPNPRYLKHLDALGKSPWTDLVGREGVFAGLFVLFAALAIHFHWFWREHPKLVYLHDPLRCLSVACAAIMLLSLTISLMV